MLRRDRSRTTRTTALHYELAPWATNPLCDILGEVVDFSRLTRGRIKLFVTATNVRTGRGRVFRNAEITPDVSHYPFHKLKRLGK